MGRIELIEESLTRSVIGAFFEVYNTLGFGFLEHLYVGALAREVAARGHRVATEVSVPVWYKGAKLAMQRLDIIVDDRLVVETKSTYELHRAAPRQLHNYLRATGLEVGLLFHFGPEAKFHRIVCLDNARRQCPDANGAGRDAPPSPPTPPAYPPDSDSPPDPNIRV